MHTPQTFGAVFWPPQGGQGGQKNFLGVQADHSSQGKKSFWKSIKVWGNGRGNKIWHCWQLFLSLLLLLTHPPKKASPKVSSSWGISTFHVFSFLFFSSSSLCLLLLLLQREELVTNGKSLKLHKMSLGPDINKIPKHGWPAHHPWPRGWVPHPRAPPHPRGPAHLCSSVTSRGISKIPKGGCHLTPWDPLGGGWDPVGGWWVGPDGPTRPAHQLAIWVSNHS